MYRHTFRVPFKQRQRDEDEPPAKKRRVSPEPLSNNDVTPSQPSRPSQPVAISGSFRKPVLAAVSSVNKAATTNLEDTPARYYNVLYRKFTNKKHKTWDADGFLIHKDGQVTLLNGTGTPMGKTACKRELGIDHELGINGKEIQVESEIAEGDFLSGRVFLGTEGKPTVRKLGEQMRTSIKFNAKTIKQEVVEVEDDEDELPKLPTSTYKTPVLSKTLPKPSPVARPTSKEVDDEEDDLPKLPISTYKPPSTLSKSLPKPSNAARPTSKGKVVDDAKPRTPIAVEAAAPKQSAFNPGARFKNPVLDKSSLPQSQISNVPTPRYDPTAEGAIVMRRPFDVPRGKQVVDVVVDPFIGVHLRDHQRTGVKFMYECVMGMRPESGVGAILADEMGLGKTLQVITLLWTLFKQNPIYGNKPVIKKALVVCPATLIKNWKQEVHKWLPERLGVYVCEDSKSKLSVFSRSPVLHVMVISYEKLRIVQEDLRKHDNIDIVIADEGHRLKTAKNKAAEAIKSLKTERRIILSGTPLQNDLTEFYMMVDFVNPGLLGKPNTFKKDFEVPILRARQPEATEDDIETGEARSEELARLTNVFILRRTSEILAKYLQPKSEYVVFCDPTNQQAEIYREILASSVFGAVLGNPDMSLQLITILKKVCNSPYLLRLKDKDDGSSNSTMSTLFSECTKIKTNPSESGKFRTCDQLLYHIHSRKEKVVIVSHYTSTLDMLGNLLIAEGWPFLRLDGSTPTTKRQGLVNQFNKAEPDKVFAFLLSAKSGGAGLNLIGASRLILYDIDWNPATDLQAMARIHRDGQTRPCKIYRLVTRGALDEKIYQRQVSKLSLSDSVIDNKNSKNTFTKEELRRLFTLDVTSVCQTHDLLGCQCGGHGGIADLDIAAGLKTPKVATPLDTMTPEPANEDEEDVVIDLTAASPEEDVDLDVKVPALTDTDGSVIDSLDDGSDDDLPPVGALIRASQLQAQERAIRAGTAKYLKTERFSHPGAKMKLDGKEKSKMGMLMGYEHVDAMLFKKSIYRQISRKYSLGDDGVEEDVTGTHVNQVAEVGDDEKAALIEDEVLRNVLMGEGCLVRYVFAKTSS